MEGGRGCVSYKYPCTINATAHSLHGRGPNNPQEKMLLDRMSQVKIRGTDVIEHHPVPGLPDHPEDRAHCRAEERTVPGGVTGREGAPNFFHRAINRQATTAEDTRPHQTQTGALQEEVHNCFRLPWAERAIIIVEEPDSMKEGPCTGVAIYRGIDIMLNTLCYECELTCILSKPLIGIK